jgi:hypothetical protein
MAKGKKKRHAGATRAEARERAAPRAEPKPPPGDRSETHGAVPRGLLLVVAGLVLVTAVIAFVVLGSGRDDEQEASAPSKLAVPWIDPDGQDPIVGAVDVNPADESVWMSTNTGLFRVEDGSGEPKQVTGQLTTDNGTGEISEQLVVRFTGDDTLVASGHPPADSALPPALGLVQSEDAGRTWTSVSELGKADFHAIQLSGDTLVAGRYGEPAIDVSRDGGKTFEPRQPPDPLVDLEVDPDDSSRWIATTQSGIFTSSDEGKTWRARDPTPNARVSWPTGDTLLRLDPGGPVKRSADGGETWEDVGSTGGEPRALFADDAKHIYAALLDGTLKESQDGGATWTDRVTPPSS